MEDLELINFEALGRETARETKKSLDGFSDSSGLTHLDSLTAGEGPDRFKRAANPSNRILGYGLLPNSQ